jgi:hypothetical protein
MSKPFSVFSAPAVPTAAPSGAYNSTATISTGLIAGVIVAFVAFMACCFASYYYTYKEDNEAQLRWDSWKETKENEEMGRRRRGSEASEKVFKKKDNQRMGEIHEQYSQDVPKSEESSKAREVSTKQVCLCYYSF